MSNKKLVGWAATIILPCGIYLIGKDAGLSENVLLAMCTIAAALTMWVFSTVPEFVPPLFAILTIILLDIAPTQIALSGFTSSSFFMLLSIFALGALMISSGLTYRLSLWILRILPPSRFWYNMGLFGAGSLLTSFIPSPMGRAVILSPMLVDIASSANFKKKDPALSQMLNSTVCGIGLVASIFLTGKPANLIVFGMFDVQTQFSFHWLYWLLAACLTGVLLTVVFMALSRAVFGNTPHKTIPHTVITQQLIALGPVSNREWTAIVALGIIVVATLTTSLHKVEIPWVALSIMVCLLLLGSLSREDIKNRIDWPTLLFIGAIISWLPIMKYTNLDQLIIGQIGFLGEYMQNDFSLFIGMLSLAIIVMRFALPGGATTIIFITAMFPVAAATGVSPWIIGFVILTISEGYIFPYQCAYHLQLRQDLANGGMADSIDENRMVLFNVIMLGARIAVIYASLPYWKWLGVL